MSVTPERFAFYGDDFTGSTDSLDMLARHGINAILIPERAIEKLGEFTSYDVIGIAGQARSMAPKQMTSHLPRVFEALKASGRTVLHYKVCSTFDSAPDVGNIAFAAGIAMRTYGKQLTPVLGGAPTLSRYCVFGNLFASYSETRAVYRVDRHPVMSNHPVTPMREGDLREHFRNLDPQAMIESLNILELRQNENELYRLLSLKALNEQGFMIVDALTEADTDIFAKLILEPRQDFSPSVLVGGSSIEDAFGRYWGETGNTNACAPVDQLLILSASCSTTSAVQIKKAKEAGFIVIEVNTPAVVQNDSSELDRLISRAVTELQQGNSVVMHTCQGKDDPRLARVRELCKAANINSSMLSHQLGQALGEVLMGVLESKPLPRVVLAGGDFSSAIVNSLDIDALGFHARVAPGAPLCTIKSQHPALSGIQIALKGGQLGQPDYYQRLLSGVDNMRRYP